MLRRRTGTTISEATSQVKCLITQDFHFFSCRDSRLCGRSRTTYWIDLLGCSSTITPPLSGPSFCQSARVIVSLYNRGRWQHQASTEENQETIRKELAIKHGRMMGWQCWQCQIDTKNCQKGQVAVDENNWPHVLMIYARSIFAKSHALYEFRTPGPRGSTTIL